MKNVISAKSTPKPSAGGVSLVLALCLATACSGSKKPADGGLDAPPATTPDGGGGAGSDSGVAPANPPVGLDAVGIGACGAPASPDVYVSAFVPSSCQAPHAMEVAGRYQLTAPAYPGHTRLHLDSYRDCQPLFEAYVGVPFWNSRFDIQTITPSPSTWARGDRTVTCLVVGEDGAPLPTMARDSRR
ncbi:MAG TPA: septum formation family protein [Polyangia bacterium]